MRTSLIIFTRNEIEGLKSIFPRIPFAAVDETIAVDGHSTDGTVEFLRSKGINVISQTKMGRGNAAIEGVQNTTGDIIILLSSDGNENPEDVPKLIEKLKNADVAVASRFMKGGRSDDSDDQLHIRKFGNRFVTLLVNIFWHAEVTDSTNGLRGIRRAAWDRLGIDSPYHETEFQMTIRAAKLGMTIAEIPTREGQRIGGIRYASTRKMAWTFFKSLIRELLIGKRFQSSDTGMKRDVRTHFNQISGFYEKRKRDFYLRMLRNSIEQRGGQRVIDLGCGSGLALSWLNGERVGIDFSQELLRNAREGPDYLVADIEKAPFRDAAFDLALCLDVAEHLPSLQVIDEAYRILSENGVLHLSTADRKYGLILELLEKIGLKLPEGPHRWRSLKEILERMNQSGFTCQQWAHPPIRFYRARKQQATRKQ
jgi:2-polyprenyl-3-methyl-5-hydroxy-6-metoxy-1,4-benzoquinol methylase